MRFPLLVAIILVAGVIAVGFYSAGPSARTDVPSIELSVVRDRAQPKRERPAPVNREPKRRQDAAGAGSVGATPIPAPAPTPAGGGGDDDDDEGADGDGDGDDGDDGDDD